MCRPSPLQEQSRAGVQFAEKVGTASRLPDRSAAQPFYRPRYTTASSPTIGTSPSPLEGHGRPISRWQAWTYAQPAPRLRLHRYGELRSTGFVWHSDRSSCKLRRHSCLREVPPWAAAPTKTSEGLSPRPRSASLLRWRLRVASALRHLRKMHAKDCLHRWLVQEIRPNDQADGPRGSSFHATQLAENVQKSSPGEACSVDCLGGFPRSSCKGPASASAKRAQGSPRRLRSAASICDSSCSPEPVR